MARIAGLPFWQLLGGEQALLVEVNSSISSGVPVAMITLIKQAAQQGYCTHSAKIDAISAALPKGHKITFDVNRTCATGVAALKELLAEGIPDLAPRRGAYLMDKLKTLADPHTSIGDIRSKGLFIGVELIQKPRQPRH